MIPHLLKKAFIFCCEIALIEIVTDNIGLKRYLLKIGW